MQRKGIIMAVTLILAFPIFLAVIFLYAAFYYRSKVIRCQERLERIWVENMLSNHSHAQREDGLDLFFDGKNNQFKPLRTAEKDANTVKAP